MMKKQSTQNFKSSQIPTVFTNSELGISLQKLWLQEHLQLLIKTIRGVQAEFILVSPHKDGKEVIAQVDFCNIEEFQNKKFHPFQKVLGSMTSYFEKMKGNDKLIVFFVNSHGRLSCYTCNIPDPICSAVSSSAFYQVKNNEIVIDYELLKWLYNLEDIDVAQLKKLEYFTKNERIKDLKGEFQEVDPVSVALYDFIQGCTMMFEEASRDGFRRIHMLMDDEGNFVNLFDKATLENKIAHGKSIFKRIYPETFSYFFDEDSIQKAS